MVGECVIESVELFGEVGECLEGDGPGAVCAVLEDRRAGVGAPVEHFVVAHVDEVGVTQGDNVYDECFEGGALVEGEFGRAG